MPEELAQILREHGYETMGRCRGLSRSCWLIGTRRGKAGDYGDKECQVFAGLSKGGGTINERHFVFSVSRSALASRWVKEQVGNGDEFLREAGFARFCALLKGNDDAGDNYPEQLLHSRSDPKEFRIPKGEELAEEIERVRVEILARLRQAAYAGEGRVTKEGIAEAVCTRNTVLNRSLVFLEERGFTKGALGNEMKITVAGEAELERLIGQDKRGKAAIVVAVQDEAESTEEFDVFVSHASEDKQVFVRPLAERLLQEGLRVWYDDFALKLGDSLRESIDRGLRSSRFGLVVLSHAFFSKDWPQRELNGLFALAKQGDRRILPIWHDVTADDLKRYSPMLADIKAVRSTDSMDAVVRSILEVVKLR